MVKTSSDRLRTNDLCKEQKTVSDLLETSGSSIKKVFIGLNNFDITDCYGDTRNVSGFSTSDTRGRFVVFLLLDCFSD